MPIVAVVTSEKQVVQSKHRAYHCTIANARINEISTTVIVDTGAGMSIIGGSFYDDFLRDQNTQFKLWEKNAVAIAANGQRMIIRGECVVTIELAGRKEAHNFRVIDDVGNSIILGTEFLDEWNVEISIRGRRLTIPGYGTTKVSVKRYDLHEENVIRAVQSIRIAPRSVTTIVVQREIGKPGTFFVDTSDELFNMD